MLNAVKHLSAVRSECPATKRARGRFACEERAGRVVLALRSFRLRRQDDAGWKAGACLVKRQLPSPVMLNAVKHLGALRSGCAAARRARGRFAYEGRAKRVVVALRSFLPTVVGGQDDSG